MPLHSLSHPFPCIMPSLLSLTLLRTWLFKSTVLSMHDPFHNTRPATILASILFVFMIMTFLLRKCLRNNSYF